MNPSEAVDLLAIKRGTLAVQDDGDVGLVLVYTGPVGSKGKVEVNGSGDILFKHDQATPDSFVADTTIKLPTGTAGTDGTIDVSDASANTYAEVAAHINASRYWQCYIKDALSTYSTDDALLVQAATELEINTEMKLFKDTSTALNLCMSLTLRDLTKDGPFGDHDQSSIAKVFAADGINTFTGTGSSSVIKIYQVATGRHGVVLAETLLWTGAALTTATLQENAFAAGMKPMNVDLGYSILVTMENAVAMSSATLTLEAAIINALHAA